MKKSIIHGIFALMYLGAMAISLLFIAKSGAAIFYYKTNLDNRDFTPDAGYSYRYDLNISPFIFRTKDTLVYEDGHQLNQASSNIVVEEGLNTYSISRSPTGTTHIYFAPADNSNPIDNERKYSLFIPFTFISRTMGILYLAILLPGFIWFLYFALVQQENRTVLLQSPKGIIVVVDRFFEHFPRVLKPEKQRLKQGIKPRALYWRQLFTATVLIAYFYVFMEWVFFVTMPSFMSLLSLPSKLVVFLLSALGLSLLSIIVLAVFIVFDIYALSINKSHLTLYAGIVIPTIISTALVVILIDNFTYTLFKFGISTFLGIWRGVYGLLVLLIFVYIYSQMLKLFKFNPGTVSVKKPFMFSFYLSLSLLVVSICLALLSANSSDVARLDAGSDTDQVSYRPNIILLGTDGLNAKNMSVYGYSKETTPRIDDLAGTSLVAENAFTNSGNTAGSIVSILTGKLPSQTRVLYPPDILTGLDAFQHLPGILKNLGYKTIEFGVPYYVDAFSLNIQDGFDMVNNETQTASWLTLVGQRLGNDNMVYFLGKLSERLGDRISHLLFIRDMQNPYQMVTETVPRIADEEKVDQLLDLVEQSNVPLFVHLHLMGTHGGNFSPSVQIFSKGQEQTEPWMEDFYADSILTFDGYVGKIIDHLNEMGQYDNTILVIFTDHNQKWQMNDRVPLIIHFPGDQYAGKLKGSVENLDITPTILDFMGINQPEWMTGRSLLEGDKPVNPLVFSMGTYGVRKNEQGVNVLDSEQRTPPFYQFSYINVKDCQKWYTLDLKMLTWSSGDVEGYTKPCIDDELLGFEQIKQLVINRLSADGFDTSTMP
jgi:hypothetical protein